jgi:hypothetical protein
MTEETTKTAEETADALAAKREIRLAQEQTEALAELNVAREKANNLADAGLKKTEKWALARKAELQALIDLEKANIALAKAQQDPAALAEATENLREYTEAQEEVAESLSKARDQAAAGREAFRNLAGSVLSLDGPMGKLKGALEQGRNGLKGFAEDAMRSVMSGDLFLSMGLKLIDMNVKFALEQNKVIAGFRAQTGAGDEFNNVIRQTERATFSAGVTLADTADAVQALKNEFTDFTYLNEEQQQQITETTSLLNKMGFSLSTQASVMQTATQTLGMSVGEAEGLLVDLASTARSLGMDVNEVGQAFEANKDFIVRFGEDGQEVFEEMAVAAKALGIELGTLVGVVDKFKTFDEAGRSVGRLNAILGGPFLNSIDMLNAAYEDPIEGINMLRDAFDQAGTSVEDLSGAELEAFASAIGLSTSETKKLLGATNEEMEIQRMEQEELAKQGRLTQDIMTQLNNVFSSLLIDIGPLIDELLVPLVEWLGEASQAFSKLLQSENGIRTFFTVVFGLLGMGIGMMLGFTAAIPGVGPFLAATASLQALGYIAAGAAIGGLGGSVLGLGLGSVAAESVGKGGKEKTTPHFANGGVVGTSTAIVGEHGPELVEMPVGSRVTTAPATKQLTDAITKLSAKLDSVGGGPIQLDVYIGREKIDEIVVKALNSPAGKRALSPYAG